MLLLGWVWVGVWVGGCVCWVGLEGFGVWVALRGCGWVGVWVGLGWRVSGFGLRCGWVCGALGGFGVWVGLGSVTHMWGLGWVALGRVGGNAMTLT